MITQEQIRATIERAEKQKQELQELINSLSTVEVKQEGRQEKGEIYWYVNTFGEIYKTTEFGLKTDDKLYESGNYYLTEADAIRAEKQIRLYRLLDRFSRQNGWTDELWEDEHKDKWYIGSHYDAVELTAWSTKCYRNISRVYFTSESVAQQAIKKYRELIMEVMGE